MLRRFLDLLKFGNRWYFFSLEQIGRQFHLAIDRYFVTAPFIAFNLEIVFAKKIHSYTASTGAVINVNICFRLSLILSQYIKKFV